MVAKDGKMERWKDGNDKAESNRKDKVAVAIELGAASAVECWWGTRFCRVQGLEPGVSLRQASQT